MSDDLSEKDVRDVLRRAVELLGDELKPEEKYRNGDKEVLISTLVQCGLLQIEIPAWAVKELANAYLAERPKSWDDLFGPPVPKGKSVHARNQKLQKSALVVSEVNEPRRQGRATDEGLFEEVGKKFDISGATAKNIYYDEREKLDAIISIVKELAGKSSFIRNKLKI